MDGSAALRDLRAVIIKTAAKAREGHIPSALSVLDILWVLYADVLRIDPRDPDDPGRDRFVLSKGHAALGLYAVLDRRGFFGEDWLASYCGFDSPLGGHPDRVKIPGVEASTGSLGHGLPIATGMALGLRIQERPARVVCLVGDGEINEGSIWEAALLCAHHRLDHLTCVIDDNRSSERALGLNDIGAKFASFDWRVSAVDGHDHRALREVFASASDGRPHCVVASTTKGHGCGLMVGDPAWHHRAPSEAEVAGLLESLA